MPKASWLHRKEKQHHPIVTLTMGMTKIPIIFCPSGILLEEDGGRPKLGFRAGWLFQTSAAGLSPKRAGKPSGADEPKAGL